MSDLITANEASLLGRDREQRPWQQAMVLQVAGGLTRDSLLALISERISYAPRFRKVVAGWPIAGWVDDPHFNLGGHVEEITLVPAQTLLGWVGARLTEPLTRSHPLWKLSLINGLGDGSQAVVIRINPALVDGYANIHLLQELLDDQPQDFPTEVTANWQPSDPARPKVAAAWSGLADPINAAKRLADSTIGLVENQLRGLIDQPSGCFLATTTVDLAAVDQVSQGFNCSVHDVLLTLASAGIRGWLAELGRDLAEELALVPEAVVEPEVLASAIGCEVIPSFYQLPLTAKTAAGRLQAIASMTAARPASSTSVPRADLAALAGFAVATMHSVAANTVAVGRPHSVLIADLPGPDRPRYLGPVQLKRVVTYTALSDAEKLSLNITSYQDSVELSALADAPLESWTASVAAELNALRAEC